MTFDPATISACCALSLAISASVLLLASRFRADAEGLKLWAYGGFAQALGMVLFAGRGRWDDIITVILGNSVLGVGTALTFVGCRVFFGKKAVPNWLPPLLLLIPIVGIYAVVISPDVTIRIFALSAIFSALALATAYELLSNREAATSLASRVIGGFYLSIGLLLAARAVSPWVVGLPEDPLQAQGINLLTLFGSIVGAFGHGIFVILLAHQRMVAGWEQLASVDSLTGCLNRRAFDEIADRTLSLCRRQGAPAGVMIMDLDNFKQINDRHGHPVGDMVLRRFAEIVGHGLRKQDVFGRIGGEEFAILLPATPAQPAIAVAERLRLAVANGIRDVGGSIPPATVSVGIVTDAQSESVLGDLIARADQALYRAKGNGRNRVEVEDAAQVQTVRIGNVTTLPRQQVRPA